MPSRNVINRDIIIALPGHIITHMIEGGAHLLPRPWLYFPPIPPHIQRVWIYDDDEEAITTMLTLNRYTLPSRLYHLTNPLSLELMEVRYNFRRYCIPTRMPDHIRRRFRRRHLIRLW